VFGLDHDGFEFLERVLGIPVKYGDSFAELVARSP
jgi:hypothetical protein